MLTTTTHCMSTHRLQCKWGICSKYVCVHGSILCSILWKLTVYCHNLHILHVQLFVETCILAAIIYYIGSTAMPPMEPPAVPPMQPPAVPAPGTRKLLSKTSSSGSLFAAVAGLDSLDRDAVKRELPNDVEQLKDLVLRLQALSCFFGLHSALGTHAISVQH